jgi:cell division septation protein DedD
VQIAGCEDESYALTLVGRYQNRGYEPFVVKTDIDGITYYRVRIGMLYSLDEAILLRQELADLYSVDGWIDYVR